MSTEPGSAPLAFPLVRHDLVFGLPGSPKADVCDLDGHGPSLSAATPRRQNGSWHEGTTSRPGGFAKRIVRAHTATMYLGELQPWNSGDTPHVGEFGRALPPFDTDRSRPDPVFPDDQRLVSVSIHGGLVADLASADARTSSSGSKAQLRRGDRDSRRRCDIEVALRRRQCAVSVQQIRHFRATGASITPTLSPMHGRMRSRLAARGVPGVMIGCRRAKGAPCLNGYRRYSDPG